jgi:hypothetical protein
MFARTGLRRYRGERHGWMLAVPVALAIGSGGGAEPACAFGGYSSAIGAAVKNSTVIVPASQLDFSVDDIEGSPGQDLQVTIHLPSASQLASAGGGASTFILVRNIPPGVRLSAGMASGRLWVLPLHDVAGLQLSAQPEVIGSFVLDFNLVGANNQRLAQHSVALKLQSFEAPSRVGTAAPASVTPQAIDTPQRDTPQRARTPRRSGPLLTPQEEAVLLKRGEDLLSQGGIAAARILFEELSARESAKGALALARSYDPAFSTNARRSAIAPDLDKALMWYRRADELGSAEARNRLAEIDPRQ